jgi:hypothetical protein
VKFYSQLDAQLFLTEIKEFSLIQSVNEKFVPTHEQLTSFIKARTPLVKKIKDHRKSANQKSNWRENRYKMMKGIKAFHRSVEGKRYHRRLGRFLASRIVRKKEKTNEELEFQMLTAKQSYLKGLNSAKQHLFVELEYFHPLDEQIQIEEFIVDYALPYFRIIEKKIVEDTDLSDDELVFIFDLTEKEHIISFLSDKTGKTFEEIKKLWESIADSLTASNVSEENEAFYPKLFSKLASELNEEK